MLCTTLATDSCLYVSFDNRVPIHVVAAPMPQQQFTKTLISLLKQLCLESAENEQIFPVSNARHGNVGCQSTADGFVIQVRDNTCFERLALGLMCSHGKCRQ